MYLDTRFWIIARDVVRGEEKNKDKKELVSLLREKAASGEIICPISETIFYELYKQEDPVSRLQTINLIDELSFGITLQPQPERIETEISYFFHKTANREELWPLDNLVWTKVSYIFGQIHPHDTPFDSDTELSIQKDFFDYMWELPLKEIERYLGGQQQPKFDSNGLADKINGESSLHNHEIKSFKNAYKTEMKGALSVHIPTVRNVIEGMCYKATGSKPVRTESEKKQHESELLNFFSNIIEKKTLNDSLRTLHITALCHATYRHDKNRNLKPNDFFDFHHAAAAVGYCDLFLTERTLTSLLNQKNLNLNKDFTCKVISNISEALQCLRSI